MQYIFLAGNSMKIEVDEPGPDWFDARLPGMRRESKASKSKRVGKILAGLRATYPGAHCELNFRNPLELLVATVLSAQCNDIQVNRVTADIFQRYRSARDYAAAPPGELEAAIQRLGLYRNKARNIRAACAALDERHGGEVPADMEALVALDGVGRKTANVVLGNAFGINAGIVVDTHVARLAHRLDLSREKTPEKIERDLQHWVPVEDWTIVSHWLIWHGRRRCLARRPDCPGCEIRNHCPSADKVGPPRQT